MKIKEITTLAGLEALEPAWRELTAGHPLLGPDWLGTWWRHFGAPGGDVGRRRQLALLEISDAGDVVALAPWYLERSLVSGRVLRFLGAGEVCTDRLALPCLRGYESRVAGAIAEWLCTADQADSAATSWDLLSLEGVATDDLVVAELAKALAARGALTDARPAASCWRLELPASWDEYLTLLSHKHRGRVRKFERAYFDTQVAQFFVATTPEQVNRGFQTWAYLLDSRWTARGKSSVLAKEGAVDFYYEAAMHLFERGELWLSWLEVSDRPATAQLGLISDGVIYAYQSGLEPTLQEFSPGTLSMIATLHWAIERRYRAIDFLRGDEPYKHHWRAQGRAAQNIRVLPGDWAGRLRHSTFQATQAALGWLKTGRGGYAWSAEHDVPAAAPVATVT